MISPVRHLTRQTLVYGTGNILTRLVTFLLLPLFTNVLKPAEYGLVTLVYVFLGFMNIIYHYGLDSAFMRFYSDANNPEDRQRVFASAIWLSLMSSVVLSLGVAGMAKPLSSLLLGDPTYSGLFLFAAGILLLDTLLIVPLTLLRMEEKATTFICVKLLSVLATLGLNVYLVAILKRGIEGVFQSVFIASALTATVGFLITLPSLRVSFSKSLAKEYLKFGLPFVPAGLSSIAMEMIDRYILVALKDEATVGIYSAGYKLGIFMLLLTTAFNYAWQPFFLKMGKQEESRPLFGRIFTYFTATACFVWILLSAFMPEIIRLRIAGFSIIGPQYYASEAIIPLILLAYIFQGLYFNFLPGIYFEKKTHYIPIVTACGAIVNIGLNFLLIPTYGIMGAAVATLAGYILMATVTFFISRRLFAVAYQWDRIIRIVTSTALSAAVLYLSGGVITIKILAILLYVLLLITLRVVSPKEGIRLGHIGRNTVT